jgi:hypothetical protein
MRDMETPKYNIDYKLIKEPMGRLLESVPNRLERELPALPQAPSAAARTVLLLTIKVLANTFKTIRFLCVEKSADWRHRPELALSTPPRVRSIADTLCNCIFLFEDLPARAEWFIASGYREAAEMLDRARRDYPSSADWQAYVAKSERGLLHLEGLIGKPPQQLLTTKYWPTPPQMKKQATLRVTRDFLNYLEDWFYRELSSVSHLSLPGLISVARPLVLSARRDEREEADRQISIIRGHYAMSTVILTTAVFSEVEMTLRLGGAPDINSIWDVLNREFPYAREIYDRRDYDKL